jgi:hypothetical protein
VAAGHFLRTNCCRRLGGGCGGAAGNNIIIIIVISNHVRDRYNNDKKTIQPQCNARGKISGRVASSPALAVTFKVQNIFRHIAPPRVREQSFTLGPLSGSPPRNNVLNITLWGTTCRCKRVISHPLPSPPTTQPPRQDVGTWDTGEGLPRTTSRQHTRLTALWFNIGVGRTGIWLIIKASQ